MSFCPKCGKEVSEDTKFCPDCGQDTKAPKQETVRDRPSGITLISILQILASLGALIVGAFMVLLGGALGTIELPTEFPAYFTGVVAAGIGLVLILIGVLGFVVAYGFWNGRGWAWTIGIVLNVIGLISNLASLPSGIISLLFSLLILYYLTRPHVKRYFGKKPKPLTI